MILTVLLALPLPIMSMYMIDRAVVLKDLKLLEKLALLLVAMIVLRQVFSYWNEKITLQFKEQVIFDIQQRLINRIERMPLAFFLSRHSVYLQSRVMSDARAIEGALVRSFVSLLIDAMTFVSAFGMVLWIKPRLAFVLCAFLVPFAYVRYFANEKMKSLSAKMQETQAQASAVVNEAFAGIRTIKSYCRQSFQSEIVFTWLQQLKDIYIKTNWFAILGGVTAGFLTSACIAYVLWYGCSAIISGEMTLGQVFAITTLLGYMYSPVTSLVSTNFRIQQATASITRIYEFLDSPIEDESGITAPTVEGQLQFKNVSFKYPGCEQLVLKEVSFVVPALSTVALVGRTGAGKSTLINLLLRFYHPDQGSIYVDNQDISKLSLASIRQTVGLVDQHPFLFSGTILDNVRFGNPDANFREVMQACEMSYADEFIRRLPDGYYTTVGERGVRLSGGQRQRIALARVFLKRPKILILDEAVSEIDSKSEKCIQKALLAFLGNCTTIIVAHRLSSLMVADRVIVMDGGAVIEQGLHRDLMHSDSAYASLFKEQFALQLKEIPSIDTIELGG